MHVRDAVEADAPALAAIADAPTDVMRNLVHDRTVRVAEDEGIEVNDPNADVEETDTPELLGFVSFDAATDTVHITQLGGTEAACERLLEEPMRFARTEGMAVELLVTDEGSPAAVAAEQAGFEQQGTGPRFEHKQTLRYRFGSGD
ncbi:hypothetical protein [Haloarchaeobius sp. HME9146]|uniref:hypothetical protein n=1 Tax=Haloarchaeobius sp. HME9146 TaxID=2978732 RepID=UPI0021C1EE14|nr:hypothetical protein [Haloarchaeobius sp. HME9146]MCT9094857.1 hypothetical protein [Haloarchaeobius sp. HME9146]